PLRAGRRRARHPAHRLGPRLVRLLDERRGPRPAARRPGGRVAVRTLLFHNPGSSVSVAWHRDRAAADLSGARSPAASPRPVAAAPRPFRRRRVTLSRAWPGTGT